MKTLLSIICNKKLKNSLIIIILLSIYIFICAFTYVSAVESDISDSVFRLHVIANSDSEEDQNLKYKVRDKLIEYMNNICDKSTSKEEAIEISKQHIEDFKNIAKTTILENGFNYNVNIEIGNFEFPKKEYGDITLPQGEYDALRVKIGEANGHNWWCVLFPPLCFVNVSSGIVPNESKKLIKENLTDDEYSIITNDNSAEIQFKIGLLELLKNNNTTTAKK